jgi:hypothetical protein
VISLLVWPPERKQSSGKSPALARARSSFNPGSF